LSPEEFDELVTPLPDPTGVGDGWAVALGRQDNANIQLLDDAGRMVAATRIVGDPTSGARCGTSSRVAMAVNGHSGAWSVVFFDIETMTSTEHVPFGAEVRPSEVRVVQCGKDETAIVQYRDRSSLSTIVDWIGPIGSTRRLVFDETITRVEVSWPYLAAAPLDDAVGPVEVFDLRVADGMPSVINMSDDQYVGQFGSTARALDIPADHELRWVRADGTEFGLAILPRTRDAASGATGTILATTAGIALLATDNTAALIRPQRGGWSTVDIVDLIGLNEPVQVIDAKMPTAITAAVPEVQDDPTMFAVNRPTFVPPASSLDIWGWPAAIAALVAVFALAGFVGARSSRKPTA
jgi:hypothetical protein